MVALATPSAHPLVACNPNVSATPNLTAVSCAGQNVISAPISKTNGLPVLSRMRAISIAQGQCATIDWQLHDKDGNPVNLTPCGFTDAADPADFKVVLRLKEHLALGNNRRPVQLDADVVNAEEGRVQVSLDRNVVGLPGIYFADLALISTAAETANTPCVIFSNTFYLVINRSTFGQPDKPGGPPSMAEIRLHLRDSSPNESYLIEHLMFDDAEIALAIVRPVQYWNEVPPPIDNVYNTQTFPFRYHWLEGICANLFLMVAEGFRRNQLDYSAAGVTLNDQNKEANYERAGQTRWQAYREWVRATKASINLEGCYGQVTSNYKYSAYTDAIRIRY